MSLMQDYLKDIIIDSTDIDKNQSRSCKYCEFDGLSYLQTNGNDYCYHCRFYKKNKNFKLKKEILFILEEAIK